MDTLEIRLFGHVQLARDGHPLGHHMGKRVRDLLGYLFLHRGTLFPREHIAGLIWSELDDRNARRCLNTALWRLHRLLGEPAARENPYLCVDAQTIGFNVASDFWLDVEEFERRCAWAGQLGLDSSGTGVALLHQAVELYRGDLMIGCYEDWCLAQRERLQALYLGALHNLFAHHARYGTHDEAVDLARRILTVDPLREDIHRELIQSYLAAGQPASALRQYRACEALLRRELGIEPMPETRALLPAILRRRMVSRSTKRPSASPRAGSGEWGSLAEGVAATLRELHEVAAEIDAIRDRLHNARRLLEGIMYQLEHPVVGTVDQVRTVDDLASD